MHIGLNWRVYSWSQKAPQVTHFMTKISRCHPENHSDTTILYTYPLPRVSPTSLFSPMWPMFCTHMELWCSPLGQWADG